MTPRKIISYIESLKTEIVVVTQEIGSKQVSLQSGEPQRSVCDWIAGRKNWSYEKILHIADSLKITIKNT